MTTHCTCGASISGKGKTGLCHPCALRRPRSAESRAKASAAMLARHADPEFHEAHRQATEAGVHRFIAETPGEYERRVAQGRRVGARFGARSLGAAGSPTRRAIGRKLTERHLGWCPLEYRDAYRRLQKDVGAAAARSLIEQQIDRDRRRYLATGHLQVSRP